MSNQSVYCVAGSPVRNNRSPVIIRYIRCRQRQDRQITVFFANANSVIKCSHL